MSDKPYSVEMADRFGTISMEYFETLAEAMEYADALRTKYGNRHFAYVIANIDNADLGWNDGLTEDERELMEEAGW